MNKPLMTVIYVTNYSTWVYVQKKVIILARQTCSKFSEKNQRVVQFQVANSIILVDIPDSQASQVTSTTPGRFSFFIFPPL